MSNMHVNVQKCLKHPRMHFMKLGDECKFVVLICCTFLVTTLQERLIGLVNELVFKKKNLKSLKIRCMYLRGNTAKYIVFLNMCMSYLLQ